MDRSREEWTDGDWREEWTDEGKNGWMERGMNGWREEWTDGGGSHNGLSEE